jgi:hypothetical protein
MIIDKYTTADEKNKEENKDKKVIDNNYYALLEAIKELTEAIRMLAVKYG